MGLSVSVRKPDHDQENLVNEDARETVALPRLTASSSKNPNPKYEIIRMLGKGGFAWVYLVKNLDLARFEAMKILNSDLTEDEAVIELVVKEARISANFHHQNIVTTFEVRRESTWDSFIVSDDVRARHREPFAFFTMSFVEGQSATDLMRKEGRISQKVAVRIVLDACAALEYAHGLGVIHRDIKPDNILVDRQGKAILTDFGIAKVVDQTRQTAAGVFMGTARYVSPEQASGKDIDGRSDIYSLGVALYELITGRVPFDFEQWMTVLYHHIHHPPPPPEDFCPDLDRDLRAILLKMLEKKREDRFATPLETAEALSKVYSKLGGEERHTLELDQIKTRHNFLQEAGTEVTEKPRNLVGQAVSDEPEKPPIRTVKAKKTSPLKALAAVVLLGMIGLLAYRAFRSQPRPAVGPETGTVETPIVYEGRLWVTAFPKGRLARITDEAGQNLPIANPELPLMLTLPEGAYTLTLTYRGHTRIATGYVTKQSTLAKVHAEFELEDDLFLLEDLR